MTLTNPLRIAGLSTLLFAFAGIAAAQGPVIDQTSTSAELEMSATVQTALRLDISTHGSGAAVSTNGGPGLFKIGFGNVNALGLGTPDPNVTVSADSSGALYSTPINLKPTFTGFNGEKADVTVIAESSTNSGLAREGNSSISASSSVSSSHAAFSQVDSESVNARYVGFYIPKTEVAGVKTATLIYTVTMNLD